MTRSEHQQDLFGDTAPWEDDDVELRTVATIVFPTGPDKEFDYLVPDELLGKLQAGCRVKVPLGRGDRPVIGYCVRLETKPLGLQCAHWRPDRSRPRCPARHRARC